ncbi:MAG: cystathionine gamma-synthase [Deltaproteobacteria bacterium]|nr:cystathionine gamma-synthase [Deltaproteobacteria bacterium]
MSSPSARFDTLAIHAGQAPDPTTGAVMTPIYQVSTYAQEGVGGHKGYEYSRTDNPTRTALQDCLAALEGGKFGLCFASGLAATDVILRSLVRPGDLVLCGDDVYGGTYRLFDKVLREWGVHFQYADFSSSDPAALVPERTRLVWLETPTNPLLKVSDIAAVAARCREVDAILVVDNTFATPYFQRPLSLGADIVVHSTTKYLNGHSDVVGGFAALSDTAIYDKMKFLQNAAGAVPGPMDSWLTLRGVKTLSVRMERHQKNATAIVDYLSAHPGVERVYYPMQSPVARRQMSGFGGMISFELKGDLDRARRFVAATRIFTLAESLGGVESLIETPALMTHASIEPEKRRAAGIADGLIRLSVGIEDVDDLVGDLEMAFRA